MSNFITDDLDLPAAKTDLNPLPTSANASKYFTASDFNALRQALLDIQTFLLGGLKVYKASDLTKNCSLVVVEANPNGTLTSEKGSLALDVIGSGLYQNTDGATAWTAVGGGGGGMSIGGTVTGGTSRNLLFVGAGPVLAQSNNLSYTTDGVLRLSDVGSPTPPGPDGGITYSNSYIKVSQNGQAFHQVATYSGTGPYDGYVAYGRGASADGCHIGPADALSYRPLFWNENEGKLGVGTSSPSNTLSVVGWDHDATVASIQSTAIESYAGFEYRDNSGAAVANMGYGNASVGVTFVRNKFYLLTINKEIVFTNTTAVQHSYGVTASTAYYQYNDGASSPVSDASTGRIRYNSGTSKTEISDNGGAYSPVAVLGRSQTYTKAQSVSPSALSYGANISVDAALSNTFSVTLSGATAQLDNPSNLVDGQVIRFRVAQDVVGGRALTFDTNYDFGDDGVPDLTTSTAGKLDIITAVSDGTKLYCSIKRGYTP